MNLNEKKKLNELKKILFKKKILIITGSKSFNKSGASKKILPVIKNKNYFIYFKKQKLPELNELLKILNLIKKIEPNIIIGIGGGTSIDYSKLCSVFYKEKKIKEKIQNNKIFNFKNKIKTIILPTTAGTGAEVTKFATIFIGKKKYSISDKLVTPNKYFIFSDFCRRSSNYVKASSLMDTICQSTESLLSTSSTKNSVNYSIKSLKIAFKHFDKFVSTNDKKSSESITLAANLSGKAINIAKTNGPHAVSYYFSTHHDLNHGHAVSLTINSFLYFNYINSKKSITNFNLKNRYKKLFKITKTKSIHQLNLFYHKLINKLNIEINFKKLKINIKKEIKNIIKETNLERLKNNPIQIKKENLYQIIKNNEIKNFKNIKNI